MKSLLLLCLLATTALAEDPFQAPVRTTEPLDAGDQLRRFHLPPGFEIQLVAAEPNIAKPMNLAMDARGRLWVSSSLEYPYAAKETGRDTIVVLDRFDETGNATYVSRFAEGLNIPIGIYPYRDGVIAYSISQIEYLRDTDGDDRADQRETLFGPLDHPVDTHGMQNAFRRGPDGWLYINHGFANRTTIQGRDGSSISLHSGNVYRVTLDGQSVRQYTWGQVNPFGSAWTPAGDLITADCHSKPLTLLLPGGYYSSFGKPHDGLGFAPELMSHHHGSTGLAGVAYYAGGEWPEEYRDNLFVCNVVTSRVHRDRLQFQGATAEAVELDDFITCDDPWFRPVDVRFGSDGALYIADFYNRIIGHYEVPLEHPGRDRFRGRIWRVIYRGESGTRPNPPRRELHLATTDELVDALGDHHLSVQELAADQLSDRVGAEAIPALRALLMTEDSRPSQRIWARWILLRLGQLTSLDLSQAVAERIDLVRIHGLKQVAEHPAPERDVLELAAECLADSNPQVVRAATLALGRHPDAKQLPALLKLALSTKGRDAALNHSARMAARDHLRDESVAASATRESWSVEERAELASIALAVPSQVAAELILNDLQQADQPAENVEALLQHLAAHLSAERVPELVQVARRMAADRLELNVKLYQAARRARPAAESDEVAAQLAEWREQLVRDLLSVAAPEAQAWWVAEGTNPWGWESRRRTDGSDSQYLSSLAGGESANSLLLSRPFVLDGPLVFELCGHRGDPATVTDPPGDALPLDQEVSDDTCVQLRLVDSGQVVRRAFPPRRDIAERIEWSVGAWRGQQAVFEVIDRSSATAYAWIAIGNVAGMPDLPRLDPRVLEFDQQQAAMLLGEHVHPSSLEDLARLAEGGITWPARATAIAAIGMQKRDPIRAASQVILADTSLARPALQTLWDTMTHADDRGVRGQSLLAAINQLPQAKQERVAEQLAGTNAGAALLIQAWEQGGANLLLLHRPRIRDTLMASSGQELRPRLDTLLANLPPDDRQLQQQIDELANHPATDAAALALGEQVFTRSCRTCHQARNVGTLVGPQLDGIGQRGASRLAEDLLTPYRNVDVAFRTTILTLEDGRVLGALVRNRADESWELVDSEGKSHHIDPRTIESADVASRSIMPDNFGEVLTAQERAALLGFLLQLK